ncbi:MAG TPA: lasso peptide biosynthesis B2 protein, partial [Vicinamibacterales bacterium]
MRRWLSLSHSEHRALVAALASQLAIALALRLLPFSTVRRVLARTATPRRGTPGRQADASVALLTWAVDAAGRRLGRMSTCLSRALTVQWLASRRGIVVPVHIGVRRSGAF